MNTYSRRQFLTHSSLIALSASGMLSRSAAARCEPSMLRLRRDLHPSDGTLLLPGSAGYAARRQGFNLRIAARPMGILVCQSETAVRQACRWSVEQGIPLHVRAGGHSYEGLSTGSGLVVDLSGLRHLEVDALGHQARVQGGVKQGALRWALAQRGFVLSGGVCPTVGVTGLTLGGGFGSTCRLLGLTCDSLTSLEIIDARAEKLHVSDSSHPDIMWASRGGGGNLGVVTEMVLQVHPAREIVTFDLSWAPHHAARVLDAWQRFAPVVDDGMTCRLVINALADSGINAVAAGGMFVAPADASLPTEAQLRHMLRPLCAVGSPAVEVRRERVADSQHFVDHVTPPTHFKAKSDFANTHLDAEAIAALMHGLNNLAYGWAALIFTPGGGAIARVEPDATAHPHRRALFGVQYYSAWEDPSHTPYYLQSLRQLHERVRRYFSGGAYVNYIDRDVEDGDRAYFGQNATRLMAVKAAVDPNGLFPRPGLPRTPQ